MLRLHLTLLGGFQARREVGDAVALPTRKAQALLAYLALPLGQAHPRDKLASVLWGGIRDESARASLRQALFSLRRVLGEDASAALRLEGDLVALNPAAVDVDVADFERAVAAGTTESLARAAEMYRGDLLAGLTVDEPPFEEWLLGERERLRELALEGLAKLLAQQRGAGALETAVQTALKLLGLDPLQEPVHRVLMRLYADLGRRAAALRQYQHCVSVLARELGAEPEAQTKALYQDILRQRTMRSATAEAVDPARAAGASEHRAPGASHDTTLLGRADELDALCRALPSPGGDGRVVAVLGEAGIGKSRLVGELATEAVRRGAMVLVGRSYESEQILPFGPWVDALRAGRIGEDVELLERLGATLRAELSRLLPEAGQPPAAGAPDVRPVFESVARVIGLLASQRLLLIIVEDVHWADEMSARLLAFVGRRLAGRPVLLVATAREEELADLPTLRQALDDLRRDAFIDTLTLGPLSRPDTIALVRAITRSGDEAAVERLGEQAWAVSEGNPFVAVETTRAYAEGAAIGSGRGVALPERVRDVVGRRLERLSERGQTLAGVAAVIGREFEFALLQGAAGLTEEDTAAGVEELVRRRVLHGLGERFDFTHDRVRDVAYDRLLAPRRKLLHRRIAETLEDALKDDSDIEPLSLGLHYRGAEVWDKAVEYLRQAAKRAAERGAFRDSASCSEHVLAALRQLPESRERQERIIDVNHELRAALIPLGDLTRQVRTLEEAEAIATALGDRKRLALILSTAGYTLGALGEHRRAIDIAKRGRALAEETADVLAQAGSDAMMGRAYYALGDYPHTIETAGRAFAIMPDEAYHRFGPRSSFQAVGGRVWVAMSLAEQGHFAEANMRIEEAMAIADRAEAPHERVWSRFGAGRVAFVQGDLERAAAFLEAILPRARSELSIYISRMASTLGSVRLLAGRTAEALPLLEQAAEHGHAIGFMHGHSLVLALLAEGYLRAGRLDDASRTVDAALALARKLGEQGWEAWTLRVFGELTAERSSVEATARYREALALATELGMLPLAAHCHLGLGTLYQRIGQPEARSEILVASEQYRTLGMPFWLERAERCLKALA